MQVQLHLKQHGDKYGDSPVGTGPFKFVEWKRNDSITIEKLMSTGIRTKAEIKLFFSAIPDNSARLNCIFLTGEIDLADGVNPSDGCYS